MAYISNYLPSYFNKFDPHMLTEEEKLVMKKRKKEIEDKKIKFRDSSDTPVQKKPCGCMANQVKQPESS
jgi:hypothetical protein